MIKKIILLTPLFILIIALGLIALFSYKYKNLIADKSLNNNVDIRNNDFYDTTYDSFDYKYIFHYLSFNTEYNDIPVTEHYKTKFKSNLSELYNFEKYNSSLYNYELSDLNQMFTSIEFDYLKENSFNIELLILKKPNDNYPMLNRVLYFNYLIDDNGFVDDIELIKEEIYREDDKTPIIRPNYLKFDKPENYANYFIDIVYGLEFAKYMKEIDPHGHYEETDINDIEWRLKEYALTDNLKKSYDINKGLIPKELKEVAYDSFEGIGVFYQQNYFSYSRDFPKEKKAIIPIELFYKEKSYYYNLSFSITDDYFLDNIFIVKQ